MKSYPEPVASPCIGVCAMDDSTELCRGCFRTLAEVAAWPSMNDVQRRAVIDALAKRRARCA